MSTKLKFRLPPKGTFTQGGPDDPLPYYYKPLVGRLFASRINRGYGLLEPPYETMLDVGYGSGILLPSMKEACDQLIAIDRDTDPESVRATLRSLGVEAELIQGDVRNADLPDESFDLVTAYSVLEEVDDMEAALHAIVRLLKPGGHLLVGMPRVDRLMSLLFQVIGYTTIDDEHVHTHSAFLRIVGGVANLQVLKSATIPRGVPAWGALYFTTLLCKTDRNPDPSSQYGTSA